MSKPAKRLNQDKLKKLVGQIREADDNAQAYAKSAREVACKAIAEALTAGAKLLEAKAEFRGTRGFEGWMLDNFPKRLTELRKYMRFCQSKQHNCVSLGDLDSAGSLHRAYILAGVIPEPIKRARVALSAPPAAATGSPPSGEAQAAPDPPPAPASPPAQEPEAQPEDAPHVTAGPAEKEKPREVSDLHNLKIAWEDACPASRSAFRRWIEKH